MPAPDPRVVHRDAHLLVVDKPSGLSTTAPDDGDCLVRRVRRMDPEAPRLHPSSRLDADVTGLVTFARTPVATRALMDARTRGGYRRLYLGIAGSTPEPAEGRWEWSVGIDPADSRRRLTAAGRALKHAATAYRVRASQAAGSLLELRPETGRTHQLRVHALAAGHPLLGDTIYGGVRRVVLPDGRVVSARRVMLHCASLCIPNVAGAGELELEAPIPVDFCRVWLSLGGARASLSG